MTREEMIEKARAWLAENHPLAPSAEHQVARYADFALSVLEEGRAKMKNNMEEKKRRRAVASDMVRKLTAEVAFLRAELHKSGHRFADPYAAEEASRGQ